MRAWDLRQTGSKATLTAWEVHLRATWNSPWFLTSQLRQHKNTQNPPKSHPLTLLSERTREEQKKLWPIQCQDIKLATDLIRAKDEFMETGLCDQRTHGEDANKQSGGRPGTLQFLLTPQPGTNVFWFFDMFSNSCQSHFRTNRLQTQSLGRQTVQQTLEDIALVDCLCTGGVFCS